MKKFVWTVCAGTLLVFTLNACNDKEHTGGDNTDTMTVTAPETINSKTPDTVDVPPVDPAMDTSAQQTPKM